MREMVERVETTEAQQSTIISFLARVAQNPAVLQQMVAVAQTAGLQRLSHKNGGALPQLQQQQQRCTQQQGTQQQLVVVQQRLSVC